MRRSEVAAAGRRAKGGRSYSPTAGKSPQLIAGPSEPAANPRKSSGEAAEKAANQFQTNRTYVRYMEKLTRDAPGEFEAVMSGEKRLATVNRNQKEAKRHPPTSPKSRISPLPNWAMGFR